MGHNNIRPSLPSCPRASLQTGQRAACPCGGLSHKRARRGCERDDDTGRYVHFLPGSLVTPVRWILTPLPAEKTEAGGWGDSPEVTQPLWQGLGHWMFFPKTQEALVWKSQRDTGRTQVPSRASFHGPGAAGASCQLAKSAPTCQLGNTGAWALLWPLPAGPLGQASISSQLGGAGGQSQVPATPRSPAP